MFKKEESVRTAACVPDAFARAGIIGMDGRIARVREVEG